MCLAKKIGTTLDNAALGSESITAHRNLRPQTLQRAQQSLRQKSLSDRGTTSLHTTSFGMSCDNPFPEMWGVYSALKCLEVMLWQQLDCYIVLSRHADEITYLQVAHESTETISVFSQTPQHSCMHRAGAKKQCHNEKQDEAGNPRKESRAVWYKQHSYL